MTGDKLKQVAELNEKKVQLEKLITTCDGFGKKRYTGSMPSEVSLFINSDPTLCLEVVNMIKQRAEAQLQISNQQFNSL
jgi:hypothetical protein